MKKWMLVALLAGLTVGGFAQDAVFKEVKGKVEFRLPGKDWQPAQVNTPIAKGSSVSTGFKSSAILLVNGSLLIVKPLTNLTLEEIAKNQSGPQTTVYLVAGKVKTEVKPSVGTEVTTFTVKNPTATASVRGTGFEFDGETILVNHGVVELVNQYDIVRTVAGGELASAGRGVDVPPPVPVKPPAAAVLTAEGGEEEVSQAVGDLTESLDVGSDSEFQDFASLEYSDTEADSGESALDALAADLANDQVLSTEILMDLD